MEPTPAPTPPPARAPRLPPPLFSWAYLGVCILVFLPHAAMPGPPDRFLLYGPAVADGEWWRVLTSAVEHISPFHILANGVSIWSFGTVLERQIGSLRMFAASVVTALTSAAGALGFLWFFPSAGASGVICGWLGLALLFACRRRQWRRCERAGYRHDLLLARKSIGHYPLERSAGPILIRLDQIDECLCFAHTL